MSTTPVGIPSAVTDAVRGDVVRYPHRRASDLSPVTPSPGGAQSHRQSKKKRGVRLEDSPKSASASKRAGTPIIPHKAPAGGTGSLEAALDREHNPLKKFLKVLGPGLVTGASDDDPSRIGTYSVAGASRPRCLLDKTFLSTFVAMLGTTISPYRFFWQSDQEVEEEIRMVRLTLRSRQGATDREPKYAAWDNNIRMLLSNW